jgi:hypothetical protein
MSFFGRTIIIVALVAGAASVFRRDIARIAGVLRKPAENFIRDVKDEIDKGAGPAAAGRALSGSASASGAAEKAAAAAGAAEAVAAAASSAKAEAPAPAPAPAPAAPGDQQLR